MSYNDIMVSNDIQTLIQQATRRERHIRRLEHALSVIVFAAGDMLDAWGLSLEHEHDKAGYDGGCSACDAHRSLMDARDRAKKFLVESLEMN